MESTSQLLVYSEYTIASFIGCTIKVNQSHLLLEIVLDVARESREEGTM